MTPTQFGPDARTVINALMERDWRIVHIAGHGDAAGDGGPPSRRSRTTRRSSVGDPRGVVLSDEVVSRPARDSQHARGARAGVRQLLPSRARVEPR